MAKKMLPFRCGTSQCDRAGKRREVWHIEEGQPPVCPNCKFLEGAIPLESIHLLVPDAEGSYKIQSNDPEKAKKLSLACGYSKALDAKGENFHRTTEKVGATCFECLETVKE